MVLARLVTWHYNYQGSGRQTLWRSATEARSQGLAGQGFLCLIYFDANTNTTSGKHLPRWCNFKLSSIFGVHSRVRLGWAILLWEVLFYRLHCSFEMPCCISQQSSLANNSIINTIHYFHVGWGSLCAGLSYLPEQAVQFVKARPQGGAFRGRSITHV